MFGKTRGVMDFIKRISFCCIGIAMSFGVIAEEQRVNFEERLRLQEKQERQELDKMIESVSDDEYRSYLNTQLSKAMKSSGTNTATVIVDITDMQSSQTALKRSSEISLGAMKLKSLMAKAPSAKSNSDDSLSTDMTITNKEWEFSNEAGSQQFEQLNIELGGGAVETLLRSTDIKDIFITTGSQYGTKYSAINTELGRFYPPVVAKEYDQDFLRKGYLNDLLVVLETSETVLISVTLNGYPETSFLSDQDYVRGYQLTDEVLSTLNPDDYTLLSKSAFGFTIEASKVAVEQLSKDDRTDFISEEVPDIYVID